ncbi:MAG TPA: DUF4440 domain-containing protein [Gemmatimonadaceae bacterium]|nr:DUF4440 domain-containing protein [Gemmatimonadaceae bacterium]
MRVSCVSIPMLLAASACADSANAHRDPITGPTGSVISAREGSEASHRAHLDLREERASLIQAANALSSAIAGRGLVPALADAFAEDVLFLTPRMPIIRGADAAISFLETSPIAPTNMRWEVVKANVSSDGTHGYTWALGSLTINFGAGATEGSWVFLTAWRRNESGEWKVASMVFNLRSATPQTIPAGFGTPTNKHRRNFPHSEVPEVSARLLAVDADFAALSVEAGAGIAFERFAAPDAIAIGNGLLVFGPGAIGAAFTFPEGDVLSWTPLFSDAAASGDLGFTVGDGTYHSAQLDQNFYSKYLTIWERQNTGEWRWVADLGNSRPAP